jgi:dolichol-phosphate mannosyltransferase
MLKINNIAIVTPSYNEVENILILIKRIRVILPSTKIIIVDDSSIKVNKKIKKIVSRDKQIILISRYKKLGRGTAIIKGFKEAFKDSKIRYVFEMDSDLAHDPKEFNRFFKKNKNQDYDLIIGSRYLPGGKIKNIAKNRIIPSKIINIFLRIWLNIDVSDFTSGFRLYSRKAIGILISSDIKSKGFITLSETLYKIKLANLRIGEVPITWNYRIHGKSNVDLNEFIVSLYFIIKMRFTSLWT